MTEQLSKRHKHLNGSRYQRRITSLIFITSLVFCVLISLIILYSHYQLINILLYNKGLQDIRSVNDLSIYVLVSIWCLLFLFLIWANNVASNLLGAFERIIRELDEIIENKEKRPVRARPSDELPNDLLKRINILIENIQWNNSK